jgi:hypothetical protein
LAARLNSLHHRIIAALWQQWASQVGRCYGTSSPHKKSSQPLESRKNGRINSNEIANAHGIMM